MEKQSFDAGRQARISVLSAALALALVWTPHAAYALFPGRYTLMFLFPVLSMAYLGPALLASTHAMNRGVGLLRNREEAAQAFGCRLLARLGVVLGILATVCAILAFFGLWSPWEDLKGMQAPGAHPLGRDVSLYPAASVLHV